MKEIFLILLTGHLVGDFLLQTDRLVLLKRKFGWLLLHAAIVTGVTMILLGLFALHWMYFLLMGLIFLSHTVIDGVKKLIGKDGIRAFLCDQAVHIAALAVIACWLGSEGGVRQTLWYRWLGEFYLKILVYAAGLILTVKVGSIIMEKALAPIIEQVQERICEGLKNGGKIIGMLERALTFILVMAGLYSAIGFLFAAKSILRFGEIRDPQQRKEAEYIIIGTFMSFGWAIGVGLLMQSFVNP